MDKIEIWKKLEEWENHLNEQQSKIRAIHSAWILAGFGAIGFILRMDPRPNALVPPPTLAGVVSYVAALGMVALMIQDQSFLQTIVSSIFSWGTQLEAADSSIPGIRALTGRVMQRKPAYRFILPFYILPSAVFAAFSVYFLAPALQPKGGIETDATYVIVAIGLWLFYLICLGYGVRKVRSNSASKLLDSSPEAAFALARNIHGLLARTPDGLWTTQVSRSGRCEILRDRTGSEYLGIAVRPEWVERELGQFLLSAGPDAYARQVANRLQRDGHDHHVTILAPAELEASRHALPAALPEAIVTFHGLGKASAGPDTAHYVVCSAPAVQKLRLELGLEPADLHVTLGFDPKDVQGAGKGLTTLVG